MIEFFTLMCQHPGVFFMVSVFALIFIGMTYEFILKLFKRNTPPQDVYEITQDGEEPEEGSCVVDPDNDPVIV